MLLRFVIIYYYYYYDYYCFLFFLFFFPRNDENTRRYIYIYIGTTARFVATRFSPRPCSASGRSRCETMVPVQQSTRRRHTRTIIYDAMYINRGEKK